MAQWQWPQLRRSYQVIVTTTNDAQTEQFHHYEHFSSLKDAEEYARGAEGNFPNVVQEVVEDSYGNFVYDFPPKDLSEWWEGKRVG